MATRDTKKKLPKYCFRRGETIWFKRKFFGKLYPKPEGKWYRESLRTTDITVANTLLTNRMADIEKEVNGIMPPRGWVPTSVPTYGMYAQKIIAARTTKKNGQPNPSLRVYVNRLAPSIAFWGSTPLDQILVSDCEAFVSLRRKARTNTNTLKIEVALSSMVFNWAVRDKQKDAKGDPLTNPWRDMERGMKPQAVPRERVLEDDEYVRLLTAPLPPRPEKPTRAERRLWTCARAASTPAMLRLWEAMLLSGLRVEEMTQLRRQAPKQVEPDTIVGWINSSWTAMTVIGKRGKKREVPIREELLPVLDAQWQMRQFQPQASGKALWPFSQRWIRTILQARCQLLGMTAKVTPHDLRRTFGTRCANDGMPMPVLCDIMGHSDMSVTQKYYIHLKGRDATAWMAKMTRPAELSA